MKNKKNGGINPGKEINTYVCLFFLVFVPLLLNWKIINYDFTKLDDTSIISNNIGFLSDFRNIPKAFEKDNFISKEGKSYYRPVQTLSFMVDAQISGEKPWAYHFSNLLYHILTVIALYFLLRIIGIKNNLSFSLALLFSVHPLFTDAIAWIVGRGDILAGLFGTIAFILFLKYNDTKKKIFYFLHTAAFALALFSKEISIALPFVFIFYYWFIKKNKHKIRELIPFIFPWGLIVLCFFYLRNRFLNPQNILTIDSFIKNLPQIPIYFAKLFLPFDLSPMPIFSILYTIAGIVFFVFLCVYILKLKSQNKDLIVFGLIWFLVFILPGMFLRMPLGKNHFEYLECRVYLPSIGIFIASGFLLNEIIKNTDFRILLKYFIPISLVFMVLSFNYSDVFAGSLQYYNSVIKSNPENAYALCSRGCLFSVNGNFNQALADFENSILANPTYSESYYDKGALYNSIGDKVSAERYYSEALKYDTLYPSINNLYEYAYINLASVKLSLKKDDETIDLLNKAVIKYPNNCSIHNNMGLAFFAKGDYSSALAEYNRAISLDPTINTYFNNRGMAEFKLKNFAEALDNFNKSLELKSGFQDALTNRGITKNELADYAGAISDLTSVINSNPGNGIAWYFRGKAYSKLNMGTEAENNYQMAEKLGLNLNNRKIQN
jgi:tetratricopeptide (TPR) repeat protein